ncbi:MAG: hypothetical protein KDB27_00765 [Planctomycetales bacterium]|nr:hypothetical protein [Planctomycetales bacterium]
MSNSKPTPIDRVQIYPITAAIWKNVNESGQVFYGFTLERSYKKSDGSYESTGSFGLSDALLIAKVADIVDSRIRKLYDADRQAARTESNLDRDVA